MIVCPWGYHDGNVAVRHTLTYTHRRLPHISFVPDSLWLSLNYKYIHKERFSTAAAQKKKRKEKIKEGKAIISFHPPYNRNECKKKIRSGSLFVPLFQFSNNVLLTENIMHARPTTECGSISLFCAVHILCCRNIRSCMYGLWTPIKKGNPHCHRQTHTHSHKTTGIKSKTANAINPAPGFGSHTNTFT